MAVEPSFVALSGGRAAASALVGMAFGIWSDLFRGHLYACRSRGLLLALEDGMFWLGATVLVAIGLYFANWLDIRLYAVAAMAAGAALAIWLAGPVVRPASTAATRAMQAVGRVLAWPVRRFARRIRRRPPRSRRPPLPPAGTGDAPPRPGKPRRPGRMPTHRSRGADLFASAGGVDSPA